MEAAAVYTVSCSTCQKAFDALAAEWCSCLVSERTLRCPSCGQCFCKSPRAYKLRFWTEAPRTLWDRKFEEHARHPDPQENPAPSEVGRPLILVVEDEASIQRVAQRVITALGYASVYAGNGVQGLELTRLYRPDLVLSDALMPKMDGREMCRQIKSDPEISGTKVIVMTGLYTNLKYEHEAYKSFKVDDYISKPLAVDQLRSLLQKHIG